MEVNWLERIRFKNKVHAEEVAALDALIQLRERTIARQEIEIYELKRINNDLFNEIGGG